MNVYDVLEEVQTKLNRPVKAERNHLERINEKLRAAGRRELKENVEPNLNYHPNIDTKCGRKKTNRARCRGGHHLGAPALRVEV